MPDNPDAVTVQSPFATPSNPVPPISQIDRTVKMLLDLPESIYSYQEKLDTVTVQYETRLSDLTFKALSTMMFQPKKDGEPLRIASNDEERKIATSQVLLADEKMKILTQDLNEARNELGLAKNKFLAAQLVAHLLAVK